MDAQAGMGHIPFTEAAANRPAHREVLMETIETTTDAAPANDNVFAIPEQNVSTVEARVNKLAARAAKLGVAVPTIKQTGTKDVRIRSEYGGPDRVQRYVMFEVNQPAPVRLDGGWVFAGTIEHGRDDANGYMNILRATPGQGELPREYRTDAPTCDHCRTERRRAETFVLRDADGNLRRVGRQCIRDYLGHLTAEHILNTQSFLRDLRLAFEDGMDYAFGGGAREYRFTALAVLTFAATAIRTVGWVSRANARDLDAQATADVVWGWLIPPRPMTPRPPVPSEADVKEAEAALEWVRGIDPNTDSDYLHNLRVIFNDGSVVYNRMGLAVSAMSVFQRERDKKAALAVANARPSEYVGKVGDRFGAKGTKKNPGLPALDLTVIRRSTTDGFYGLLTILVFQDAAGNDFIWFASGEADGAAKVGAKVLVTGTVKAHSVDKRTNRKQTTLSRCSLAVAVS